MYPWNGGCLKCACSKASYTTVAYKGYYLVAVDALSSMVQPNQLLSGIERLNMLMKLRPLIRLGEFELIEGIDTPAFIHNNHRYVLAFIRWAQINGKLNTPCKLILFDDHHDAHRIRNIKGFLDRCIDLDVKNITNVCKYILSCNNDDWIIAGMELGILSDAIVFGMDIDRTGSVKDSHIDSKKNEHKVYIRHLPSNGLGHHGYLNDISCQDELRGLWGILEWERKETGAFGFRNNREKFALSFDLDCFRVSWSTYRFAWPNEVWEKEFNEVSRVGHVNGWSGAIWVKELMRAAGLITFAMEPRHCGGLEKSKIIWNDLNANLFDCNLRIRGKNIIQPN